MLTQHSNKHDSNQTEFNNFKSAIKNIPNLKTIQDLVQKEINKLDSAFKEKVESKIQKQKD